MKSLEANFYHGVKKLKSNRNFLCHNSEKEMQDKTLPYLLTILSLYLTIMTKKNQ